MSFENYERMDPHLLFGLVNTALRNHYDTLEDLCAVEDLDKDRLLEILNAENYEFKPKINQFR